MPLRCNNQCCHFHGSEVSEDLRSVCARLSGHHGCSATEVVPAAPAASERSDNPAWTRSKRMGAGLAAACLAAILATAWPDKEKSQDDQGSEQRQEGEGSSSGSGEARAETELRSVPPRPLEVIREDARRDIDALVVGGNRMVKMHRALAIALAEANASLDAQRNRTEVKRTPHEVSERAAQIHEDGLLFQQAAAAKDEEIRDEIETYRNTLDRLAKVDVSVVESEITNVAGTVAGVADKSIALDLAKRHLGETWRLRGSLDSQKIFLDFKLASTQ